jgi:hypothetical protein
MDNQDRRIVYMGLMTLVYCVSMWICLGAIVGSIPMPKDGIYLSIIVLSVLTIAWGGILCLIGSTIPLKDPEPKYQCGSCENTFDVLFDGSVCPYCFSGNWVDGHIDDPVAEEIATEVEYCVYIRVNVNELREASGNRNDPIENVVEQELSGWVNSSGIEVTQIDEIQPLDDTWKQKVVWQA